MKSQIIKSIILITLIALTVSTIFVAVVSYRQAVSRQKEYLFEYAAAAGRGYAEKGTQYLEGLDTSFYITLFSPDKDVLFDSMDGNFENPGDMAELSDALSKGKGYSSRYSAVLSNQIFYVALRLEDGSVLRIGEIDDGLWADLTGYLYIAIIAIITAGVAALIAAVAVSKKIVSPITAIDLNKPEISKPIDELKPIVSRLTSQNRIIFKLTEELKVKQTEFDAITTNMSDGVIIIDRKADILSCNTAAMKMLGVTELPRSVLQLNKTDNFRETIRTSLSGKKCFDTIRTDENYYTLHATPVLFEDSVEGAVIVIIDETEKDEREKLRREFTTNVSHELKTPLTSISGFAELIKNGITTEKDTIHFAENIYREARRLISLVNDIIKLSQIDEGEIPYDEGNINVYETAVDVADRLENIAKAQKISLNVTGEAAYVRGNAQILEEMIYNLCDNGIKYNRPGGYVLVDVSTDAAFVYVSVKDNGIGIPKASQARVFERFYRVDKSHSKEIGGTGLGLSIVKHGAAYHKARISLESSVGKGTEITLVFPKFLKNGDI
jgi:two-component system phosphate regulon sensor histidine kinase PhoR